MKHTDGTEWGEKKRLPYADDIYGSASSDPVNHPSHYNAYPLENLEVIRGSMSQTEYQGFLKGNILKYLYRYKLKGKPMQDLDKAEFYRNELKKTLED